MQNPWNKYAQKVGQQTRRAQNSRTDSCFWRHQHDEQAYAMCVEYNLEQIGRRHQTIIHKMLFGKKHLGVCMRSHGQEECQKNMLEYSERITNEYLKEMERF